MRLLPCGDRALLVEVAALEEVLGLAAALRADPPPGVVDVVPAARTVLLRCYRGVDLAAVADAVHGLRPTAGRLGDGPEVTIPVRYDGVDLAEVATRLGTSPAEFVRRHTGASWTVAFCGFQPGFGYLVAAGGFPAVPRRDEPRTHVPAGSVALADSYSGVYPRATPGGWQLIGRTDLRVFDPDGSPAALLRPGVTVRFRDTSDGLT